MIIRILNDDETKFEEIYINDNVVNDTPGGVSKVAQIVDGAIHSYLDDKQHRAHQLKAYHQRRDAIREMTDIANDALNPFSGGGENPDITALNMGPVSR